MPRRPATFRQADLVRALRAEKAAGIESERIEIDPTNSKIIIIAGGAETANSGAALDTWLKNRAHTRTSQKA